MMMLGIIGEYLWRIYDDIKKRPLYIVEQQLPMSSADPSQFPPTTKRD